MNILYINHYAGSPEMGMEFRPYYFAREWTKMGHNVSIISGDYSHLRRNNPNVKQDLEEEYIDGIHYLWIKSGHYEGNGIKRAISMFRFVYKIYSKAKYIAESLNPNIIITSSTYPIDTYAGQKIKRYFPNARLVHEIHDMWPITLIEIGNMKKHNPFVQIMQAGENSFCKNSDYVCSLLPNTKDYLIRHGMAPEKFFHVSNGIVEEEWINPMPLPEKHHKVLTDLKEQGYFIICFFGSHTKSYNLDYLIDAVKDCENKVAAVFIGNGIYKDELMEISRGLSNIVFLDSVPKQSIPSLFDYIDVTYVSAVDNDMFRFGICMNKLFDSMMGGKPILYAVNAPNNYIVDYHCGVSVKPCDTEALMKGIKELLSFSNEEKRKMGENGRIAVTKNFTYSNLAKKFIEKVEGVIL